MEIIVKNGLEHIRNYKKFCFKLTEKLKERYDKLPDQLVLYRRENAKKTEWFEGEIILPDLHNGIQFRFEESPKYKWFPIIKVYEIKIHVNDLRINISCNEMEEWEKDEWSYLDFYYKEEWSNKSIDIYASRKGINRFRYFLENFWEMPDYEKLAEHIHLGPYLELTFDLWEEKKITFGGIWGTKADYIALSNIIRSKLDTSIPGDIFIIDKEYSDNNDLVLTFYLQEDSFVPESMDTIVLFRAIGPKELELVKQSGYKRWPPRLEGQPIFYPVITEAYAREMAKKWNVKESGESYVTLFCVKKTFTNKYMVKQVGASYHTEYWIPAEDLEELNSNIVGKIEVIGKYP